MNRRQFIAFLVTGALVVGTLAFVTGRLMVPARREPVPSDATGWLEEVPEPIRQAERRFEQEAQQLAETVVAHKNDLAALLADPGSADAEILAQLDRVLEANAALMRTVGTHLVELRGSLPAEQKELLMRSCAESLGTRAQRRYRWRGGTGDDRAGQSQGGRLGRGRGRGGPQYRGGRGGAEPADKLQLTADQIAYARQHDPEFASDAERLKDEVAAAYADLAAGLEDPDSSAAELLARLDRLIEAHNRLESRVARYVITILPQLSAQQKVRLAGLSRGGYRYRGGQ